MKYLIDWTAFENSAYFNPLLTPYAPVVATEFFDDDEIECAHVVQATRDGVIHATVPVNHLEIYEETLS